MNTPLAHAGHWIAGLLYLLPVMLIALAVLWQRFKAIDERKPDDADPLDPDASPEDRPPVAE